MTGTARGNCQPWLVWKLQRTPENKNEYLKLLNSLTATEISFIAHPCLFYTMRHLIRTTTFYVFFLHTIAPASTTVVCNDASALDKKASNHRIPVVDFDKWFNGNDADKAEAVAALGDAFASHGFVIAVNTSIIPSTVVSV